MALECVCFSANDPRVAKIKAKLSISSSNIDKPAQPKHCENVVKPSYDICKILERSQDHNQHNEYECHTKGEIRQNVINKIKMFLDDYDDRPVMKRRSEVSAGKTTGQRNFGPLIKYPGYVDYDHPYFSSPFDKMPNLAMTVGQQRHNPCPPISVRNWDIYHVQDNTIVGGSGRRLERTRSDRHRCQCAKRRGEVPKCSAGITRAGRLQRNDAKRWSKEPQDQNPSSATQRTNLISGARYICHPLADN